MIYTTTQFTAYKMHTTMTKSSQVPKFFVECVKYLEHYFISKQLY